MSQFFAQLSSNQVLFLLLGGIAAGVVNSFAGGGAFITLPLLIFSGLSSTVANMTSSVATWPGLVLSTIEYRKSLQNSRHNLRKIIFIAVIWGLVGSILIICSTDYFFSKFIPYLLLFATSSFIYGTWFLKKPKRDPREKLALKWSHVLMLSIVAVYGGYWGGGMGIITLAALTFSGWHDINEMNAVKNLFMTVINGVGLILFISGNHISWPRALIVCFGAAIGGHLGAKYIQLINPKIIKIMIAIFAFSMTVYFFIKK